MVFLMFAWSLLITALAKPGHYYNLEELMSGLDRHFLNLEGRSLKTIANEFQLISPENIRDHRHVNDITKDYVLNVVGPLVINNDDVVTIKYSSNTPDTKDWIAAYSPAADIDRLTSTVPVKYGWCDESPLYISDGVGELTFNLTNLRSDIVFVYYSNSTGYPILQYSSPEIVSFENNNEPLRPRVIPTGNPDVFSLLWSSAYSTAPTLYWGTSSGQYDNIVDAVTSTIDQQEMCGAPANTTGWRELGLIHTALFKGMTLLANSRVYYIFGDIDTNLFSKEYVLNVPPTAGIQPPNRGTRVVLFDDLGRGSSDNTYTWFEYGRPSIFTIESVANEVANGNVDAIYHGGDISYATGYIAVWDFYMDQISSMAGGAIYLTTVGNHESDWIDSATIYNVTDSGGECGIPATKLIPMPAPATTDQPWWSYDVGLIHMIGMSTEHNFSIGSPQYNWLVSDLQSVNRSITPWIVFGGHRAMYINSNYGGTDTSDITVMENLILNIEPLLWEYRVNIGFYGHNHAVQRHSAVLNSTVIQASSTIYNEDGDEVHYHDNPQATVHFVVGTGGAAFTDNHMEPYPEWNEMVFYEYGYTVVEAVNSTYLKWDWVHSPSGEIRDRVVITQEDPDKAWVV